MLLDHMVSFNSRSLYSTETVSSGGAHMVRPSEAVRFPAMCLRVPTQVIGHARDSEHHLSLALELDPPSFETTTVSPASA